MNAAWNRLLQVVRCRASHSNWAIGSLMTMVVLRAAVLIALGPGLILDDWTAAGNKQFLGVLETANQSRLMSRPVEWLTYTVIYGIGGHRPVILLIQVTILNLVAVIALYLVLRRYFDTLTTWSICAAWILVPNHNAMAAWAANAQSVVACILLALGIYMLSRGSRLAGAILLTLAVLGYQLTILPAIAATAFVGTRFMPIAPDIEPPRRKISVRDRLFIATTIAIGVAWTSLEPTYPLRISGPNPIVYLSAHFGEGLFAQSVPPLVTAIGILIASVGVLCALRLYCRGERSRVSGPSLVVVGLAVMVAGSLGVVLSGSQAFGMTDRLYAITSVGGVMIWIGIAKVMRHSRFQREWILVCVWCAACIFGQAVSLSSWSQAGDDVVALMRHIDSIEPESADPLVVGPRAVRRNNIVGLVSPHAPDNALWLHRGDVRGSLRIAKVPSEFVAQADGEHLITWP